MAEGTPADGAGRGYIGFRLTVAVAACAALPAAAALGVAVVLERTGAEVERALVEDVESRAEAGHAALAALDEAAAAVEAARREAWTARRDAAARRATELVLLAARGPLPEAWAPSGGERVGWADPESGRWRSWDGTRTATLAATWSELAAALPSAPRSGGPLIVHAPNRTFALLPPRATDGRRAAALVPVPALPEAPPSLAAARGRIGNLAEPVLPPPARRSPALLFALALGVAALLAALWAAARVSRPFAATLDAARAFVHGDHRARAEPRGGPEARAAARAVNALIEQAVRLQADGRSAREADIQAAATAIEQFGKGDLRQPTPRLQAPFGPVSRSLDIARKELLRRVEGLHEQARVVADVACTIAPSARRLAAVTDGQRQALDRWSEGVSEAQRRVVEDAARIEGAVEVLDTVASEQRRATQDLKATLALANRRLQHLSTAAARVRGSVEAAKVLEQALGLLGVWAASARDAGEAARATQLVGEGQAALTRVTQELEAMHGELGDLGETLQTLAEARIDPPPSPASTVGGPLLDAGAGLTRAAELTQQGLGGFARALRGLDQEAAQLTEGAEVAAGQLDALGAALSELRVGDAFETVLLERLEAAKAALAAGEDGALSSDGQALLAGVEAAADATRGRLGRLIVATEATLDVLRS